MRDTGLAILLLALPLGPGCSVTRTPQRSSVVDAGDEALLKRANEALLERIRQEEQHVETFNRQLDIAKAREKWVTNQLAAVEADYDLLDGDLAGLESDLDDIRQELRDQQDLKKQLQSKLETVRGEAGSVEIELQSLEASIIRDRQAIQASSAAATEAKQILSTARERETALATELESHELLVHQRGSKLEGLREELSHLQRTIQQNEGTRQWLRASLLATLFTSALRRDGLDWPDPADAGTSGTEAPGSLGAEIAPAGTQAANAPSDGSAGTGSDDDG
jgi:chromosome segregation ATPase